MIDDPGRTERYRLADLHGVVRYLGNCVSLEGSRTLVTSSASSTRANGGINADWLSTPADVLTHIEEPFAHSGCGHVHFFLFFCKRSSNATHIFRAGYPHMHVHSLSCNSGETSVGQGNHNGDINLARHRHRAPSRIRTETREIKFLSRV